MWFRYSPPLSLGNNPSPWQGSKGPSRSSSSLTSPTSKHEPFSVLLLALQYTSFSTHPPGSGTMALSVYPLAHGVLASRKRNSFWYLHLVHMLVEKQVPGKKEKINESLTWATMSNITEVQKRTKGVYVIISSLLTCYWFRRWEKNTEVAKPEFPKPSLDSFWLWKGVVFFIHIPRWYLLFQKPEDP